MKTFLSFFLFLTLFIFSAKRAEAIPVFYSWGGEKINTILDLPNDSTTLSTKGYVDIGCIYKQFSIFWVPIWNWDVRYCFSYENDDKKYKPLTKEEAEEYAQDYDLKLPAAKPNFWNMMGGKSILLILIAFMVWGSIGKKKEEDEIEKVEEDSLNQTKNDI